ncbi:hypothetical protein COOONC_19482 [Cooperia oncophora]
MIDVHAVRIGENRLVGRRDFDKVKLDKEGFEKVRTIHYNWYLHSIKAIMGQLGKDVLPKLKPSSRKQFLRCLNSIVDKRDLVSAAKCLIEAKEKLDHEKMHRTKFSMSMVKEDRKSKWMDSYKNLLSIKKALDERAKQPGAKVRIVE